MAALNEVCINCLARRFECAREACCVGCVDEVGVEKCCADVVLMAELSLKPKNSWHSPEDRVYTRNTYNLN